MGRFSRLAETALFQRLQKRQKIVDLVCLEPELRHGRMAGDDALGKRFGEALDRITLVQCTECWRDLERAWSYPVDRMATRAIGQRECLAALLGGRGGQRR